MKLVILVTVFYTVLCHAAYPSGSIDLLQGIMAGEVTHHSAILQSRITASSITPDEDVPGQNGIAWFQVSTDESFKNFIQSDLLRAEALHDFIVKTKIENLRPGKKYYYRLVYGKDRNILKTSAVGEFHTLPIGDESDEITFSVITGMNYYVFKHGRYDPSHAYQGDDRELGYPALESIIKTSPDFAVFTGDNVYYDHPNRRDFLNAVEAGLNPIPGPFNGAAVTDAKGVRHKYHQQFSQPRFRKFFQRIPAYWEKDDHDYRFNDSDPYLPYPISADSGAALFREQVPVVYPVDNSQRVYRTFRINDSVQIWLVDVREYRSPNSMKDGPEKTLWGETQREWLKQTLLESDASFKLLISPTPMVGPDGYGKNDNHANLDGFRYERDHFFAWLIDHGLLAENFYIICGDRHWQYHAIDPTGVEEFSCGALVDANAVVGFFPGDESSSDPEGKIVHRYHPSQERGGFLNVSILSPVGGEPRMTVRFYDVRGNLHYEVVK